MIHKIEAASDLLVSLQNTYLTNVSLEVSEASSDANNVMKNLSAITAMILPLSLIASLMGMNVTVPFQHDGVKTWTELLPFTGICLAMLFTSIILIFFFKRKDLL